MTFDTEFNIERDFIKILDTNFDPKDKSKLMLSLGEKLTNEGFYDLADICLDLAKYNGDLGVKVNAEFLKGVLYFHLDDYKKAKEFLDSSRQKAYNLNLNDLLRQIDLASGKIYQKLGDFNKTKESFEKYIEKTIAARDNQGVAHCLNILALACYNTGETKFGLNLLQQAHALGKYISDYNVLLITKVNIASLKLELGNIVDAEKYLIEALELAHKFDSIETTIKIYSMLSDISLKTGKFPEALDFANKARDLVISCDKDLYIPIEVDLPFWNCVLFSNNFGTALSEFKRLYKLASEIQDSKREIQVLVSLINLLILIGKSEETSLNILKLEKMVSSSKRDSYLVSYLKGKQLLSIGKPKESTEYLLSSIKLAEELSIQPIIYNAKLLYAQSLLDIGEHEKTFKLLREIGNDLSNIGESYTKSKYFLILAKYYRLIGDIKKATEEIESAQQYKNHETSLEISFESYKIYKDQNEIKKADGFLDLTKNILQMQADSFNKNTDREIFKNSMNRNEINSILKKNKNIERKLPDVSNITNKPEEEIVEPKEEEYISTVEAERLFGISRITVFRWIKENKIPAIRLGNRRFKILLSDLKKFIKAPKSGKTVAFPPLETYLAREEERYLRIVLDTTKDLTKATITLGISKEQIEEKIKVFKIETDFSSKKNLIDSKQTSSSV
jgi:excisionase family DNA binding protein